MDDGNGRNIGKDGLIQKGFHFVNTFIAGISADVQFHGAFAGCFGGNLSSGFGGLSLGLLGGSRLFHQL